MLDASIKAGVIFLAAEQEADGSFLSLTSRRWNSFSPAEKAHAIVPSNIVLSSLNTLEETAEVKEIKRKVADLLLKQRGKYWSMNYWLRDSASSKTTPYPDDLDDTFCGLAALYEYDSGLFDGAAMAKIVTGLTAAEVEEGGPYDMWWVVADEKKRWKRVDLVVNSNVGYFLSLQGVHLPKLEAFVESEIEKDHYVFPYVSVFPAIYFLSRFYRGEKVKHIVDLLWSKQKRNGSFGNPLQTGLALAALRNFGVGGEAGGKLKKGVSYLLGKQKNGGWGAYAFYVELKDEGGTYYSGAASLTTAICLEAINKVKKLRVEDKAATRKLSVKKKNLSGDRGHVYAAVISGVRGRLELLDGDLRDLALGEVGKIVDQDGDGQIGLLPYWFAQSLEKKGVDIEEDFLVKLGMATMYGWMAYEIYDDFFDEGKVGLLSIANVCLRELTGIFGGILSEDSGFGDFFVGVMDRLDGANAWEVSRCRFDVSDGWERMKMPDYGDLTRLAERSLGHMLGPVAVLVKAGYAIDSAEVVALSRFFELYLVARQLNDDMHDWEEDLSKGQMNAVGVMVVGAAGAGRKSLQEVFWYEVVGGVCGEVLDRIAKAEEILKNMNVMAKKLLFSKMLEKQAGIARETLNKREETVGFLEAYGDER